MPNVIGSVGSTPNSIVVRYRVSTSADTTPHANPAQAISNPCRIASASTDGTPGPQCHADADFGGALRDRETHHTVKPDRREHDGDEGEPGQQRQRESTRRQRVAQQAVERLDAGKRQARIDGPDGAEWTGRRRPRPPSCARRRSSIRTAPAGAARNTP